MNFLIEQFKWKKPIPHMQFYCNKLLKEFCVCDIFGLCQDLVLLEYWVQVEWALKPTSESQMNSMKHNLEWIITNMWGFASTIVHLPLVSLVGPELKEQVILPLP